MSQINVTTIRNRTGGPPSLDQGVVVGSAATFSSTVSIAGTLTYEDVTSIDSVGIITAQSYVSIADSIVHTGDINTSLRFPANDTFTVETAGSERLRINSSGNVAINVDSADTIFGKLHVKGAADANFIFSTDSSEASLEIFNDAGSAFQPLTLKASEHKIRVGNTEKVRIDTSGNVGIGSTIPTTMLDVGGAGTFSSDLRVDHSNNAGSDKLLRLGNANNSGTNSAHLFTAGSYFAGPTDVDGTGYKAKIDAGTGAATFGTATTTGCYSLNAYTNSSAGSGWAAIYAKNSTAGGRIFAAPNAGGTAETITMYENGNVTFAGRVNVGDATSLSDYGICAYNNTNGAQASLYGQNNGTGDLLILYSGNNLRTTISAAGNATFSGALSKGSGSFKISHPLPEKTETHNLVHSFIEGPQADLIYSGMVTLVAGKAEINLDTAARMTEGTFLLLNTNLRRFVSNEGGWTAVKSSITGNVLTVEAQDDTCTDEVFWTVIGERKDQHMIDTSWTDENGRVITEPLK